MPNNALRTSLRLGVLLAVCLLALARTHSARAADTPAASDVKGLRIFSAGHSFHYFMPPILADVAAKAKIADHKQIDLQAIGGSQVIAHWNLADDKNKVKAALKTGEVDVLTLSPIYLPDAGIEKLASLGLEHNPNIRITIQEFWLPFDDVDSWKTRPKTVDRDAKTIDELRKAHAPYFQSMDDHIRELNTKMGKQVLFIVPVGQAVLGLREKVINGEAPGIKKQSELFTDVLGHCNAPIMVLETYCHFAVIYKTSPVGLPVPKAIANRPEADKLNSLLQQLAWDAVTDHSLSGVKR